MPDPQPDRELLAALPSLPREDGGPVFAEPWQAQAFALAVRLSALGYFTWNEWAAALAHELKSAADRGAPDDGSRYYEHWLAALERLATAKGLSNPDEMLARKEAWADAYRRTPHGKPVALLPRHTSEIDSCAQSPCIRNCCLDDDLTCLGCFRSLEEIKEWGVVDDHRRRIILQNARQRREAYAMPGLDGSARS
jgi:nitrile hydratase accessory protein